MSAPAGHADLAESAFPTLAEVERQHIVKALEVAHGNQRRACRLLGISRWTLARRMQEHGIPRPKDECAE